MGSAPVKRGKLAYKFLFWFLLISIVPIGVVGLQLVQVSQKVLKEESLRTEQSQAVGFAETVNSYITTFKNVLSVASRLEGFSSMDPVQQQRHLNRVMQQHSPFLELSVFDLNGHEMVRMGRFLGAAPEMRDFSEETCFRAALKSGEYMGSLERAQGLYPTIVVALPILDNAPGQGVMTPRGVLMGKISLTALSQMLRQQFPEKSRTTAFVVAVDGFLVAHSDPTVVYRQNSRIPKEIVDVIASQGEEKGGGEIEFKDGRQVLGAYATIKELGWVVYIQQPVETAYLAAEEMRRQVFKVVFWVIGLTVLLSLFVAGHITMPIRALKEAADRLKAGRFEDLPEMTMGNDEIGDLAQSFVQMSESLKEKTGELLNAKDELTKYGQDLEKRVQARTRELKAAQDELIKKERLAAIGQMASVVGHEIRNPLAVINNSIFFIKTKLGKAGQSDPKIDKHIVIIESEIKQANGIINEILTYSRSRELKCEILPLNHFLEELLSVYPFPSHVEVSRSFDQKNPLVRIDQDEMRQAVRNLVGNGIEVMPSGGIIRVATEIVDPHWVRLDVGDTGAGIPPDIIEKIFAPFFTTKARGTGLGLAVVRKVVDRHQGRVDVESAVGKGTTFKIFLPLAVPSASKGPEGALRAEPRPAPSQPPEAFPPGRANAIPQTQLRPTT
jgi:signal transduction histidine kinase